MEKLSGSDYLLPKSHLSSAACKADSANGSGMQRMHKHNWLLTRKSEVLIGRNPFHDDFYTKIYDCSSENFE